MVWRGRGHCGWERRNGPPVLGGLPPPRLQACSGHPSRPCGPRPLPPLCAERRFMRRKAVAAAVLALCAATVQPAHADPGYREWLNICGPGLPGLTTCGSVKLQVVGTSVTLWVKNLSGLYGSYQNFV